MVKRTQGLPLNTIVLAIIAIVVLVFLIENFILPPNQPTPPHHPILSPNQKFFALCSEYASVIQTKMEGSINSSTQLQLLANSQYVSYNCSISIQYTFTLYNGSEVICGLNSSYCINLQGSGCNHCTPPNCIPGCELQ
jgi:hypothetical protein